MLPPLQATIYREMVVPANALLSHTLAKDLGVHMDYPSHDDAAADPWCFAAGGYSASSSFADMIAGDSTGDLYEMTWGQGRGAGAPESTTTTQPAAESCRLWSPPPEVRFDPPSEDEMAAWLCAIVKGEDELVAFNAAGRDVPAAAAKGSSGASTTTTSGTKEKLLPKTEVTGTKQEIESRRESSSRSHHREAHNLTEKRRRHKINERLRTLQQLVPGCDKARYAYLIAALFQLSFFESNQASTLDQTIQYMKSLQHHVQEMSGVGGPARPAAVPVVPPQYAPQMAPAVAVPTMMPAAPMVLAPAPTTMVPFGAMVQLPHYPAAAAVPVMMPAAAAHLYPAAAAPVAPESSATHRHGSSRSKAKGGSSQRKKH